MKAFLDANILFSAAKSDGAVRALLRLLLERGHEAWVDAYVVAEARRNLMTKGPEAIEVLDALLTHLRLAPFVPGVTPDEAVAWLPEKDRPVLAAAIRAGCDVLVTGDRTHFGPGYGRTFSGVAVITPSALAQSLLG
jgi:predicted nucleic acid-binding protein